MRWHLWQLSLNVFKCPTNRLQKLYGLFIYYKLKLNLSLKVLPFACTVFYYCTVHHNYCTKQLHTFVHVHVRPS